MLRCRGVEVKGVIDVALVGELEVRAPYEEVVEATGAATIVVVVGVAKFFWIISVRGEGLRYNFKGVAPAIVCEVEEGVCAMG